MHKKWLNNEEGVVNADFRFTDLGNSDLSWVDLRGADLRWAYLRLADLRGANLIGANLRWADFRGANLSDAKIDFQIEEGLLEKVAHHALNDGALDMENWHTCETTHCIAGWACHLAVNGKKLEEEFGTQIAGLLLLGVEAHSHFFDSDDDARKYLQSVIEKEIANEYSN